MTFTLLYLLLSILGFTHPNGDLLKVLIIFDIANTLAGDLSKIITNKLFKNL